ncbi:hypothetical protein OIU78_002420 [Salix suchowensis]|nr:hypothetical protein OIU78_002420 [Salix suchowensis]
MANLALLFLFLFSFTVATTKADSFSRNLSPETLGLKREKLSHLHFYFHDTLSGENPTAVPVAQAATTNKSSTSFGLVVMIDNPLTVKPEVNSEQASITVAALVSWVATAYFSGIREMPIVGGSGLFRFARGYAKAKTYMVNLKTNDAIVEYDVYVFHY